MQGACWKENSAASARLTDRTAGWPIRRTLLAMGLVGTLATALALCLPLWLSLILVGLVVAVALLIRRTALPLLCVTAAVYLLFAVGYRHWVVEPLSALDGQVITLSGQVTERPTDTMVTLTVSYCDSIPRGTRVALYCAADGLDLFDTITTEVNLMALDAGGAVWGRRGVYLCAATTAFVDEEGWSYEEGALPATHLSQRWRGGLQDLLRSHLSGDRGDLLAALCLGIKSGINPTVLDAFQGSGLSHILVVSGLHLTTLAVAVMALLRRLFGMRPAAAVTALVVVLFMWMQGGTPSVLRAGVMCLTWLIGYVCRRRPDGLNSLGLALLVLLPVNPYYLWDAGFQLSFCATAGVLLWFGRQPRCAPPTRDEPQYRRLWWHWRTGLTGAVTAFFGATVATLPLVCYYYGGFPLLGLVSNLLAVTPAGTALLLGWLGLLLCAVPYLSWAGRPLLLAAAKLMDWVAQVAAWCSPDWGYIPVTNLCSLTLVGGLCLLITYGVVQRTPLRRLIPAVCSLLTLSGVLLLLY